MNWPAWLRRRTAVEALGTPDRVLGWTAIALSFLMIAFVGFWNAAKYPVMLGYDAQPNVAYAHVLLTEHRTPTEAESGEARQPPGYFLVAGLAARAGGAVFGWQDAAETGTGEASLRGAQVLNVFLVLATALLLLLLARLVIPSSPAGQAAALAFFAFLPVVAKTEAMFHPEPLNMFLSTAAIYLTVAAWARGRVGRWTIGAVAAILLFGFFTRASIVFVGAAIVVSALASVDRRLWRRIAVFTAVALVVLAAVGAAVRGGIRVGTFEEVIHPRSQTAVVGRDHFFDLWDRHFFDAPYRPQFRNAAFLETYTEAWGDWIGAFAWSPYSTAPWTPAMKVLQDQQWIGVLPSLLALAGFVALALSVRRRRWLLPIALALPIATVGYLVRSYQLMSADGDLLKASYTLNVAPVWALGFGYAFMLLARLPRTRVLLGLTFAVFAILELRFMLYGLRDHQIVF